MKNNKILELQWIFKPIDGIATEIHASNIEIRAIQKIAELMFKLERRAFGRFEHLYPFGEVQQKY